MNEKQLMPLSVRLPKSLYDKLDDFCERYSLDRPQAVRMALTIFFEAHEKEGGLLTSINSPKPKATKENPPTNKPTQKTA